MGEFVRLEVDSGVGTIRLDRPPVNALNNQVQTELAEAAREATDSDDVRAVIIYGGQKTFAGGADIKEMAARSYVEINKFGAALQASLASLAAIPKPTVAAVTGYALGGGLELALTADRRIAGDNVKVGLPEITLGIIPGAGGTQRLARLIGTARALEMSLRGRTVSPDEAARIGMVHEVVDGPALDRALVIARECARKSPLAVKHIKRLVRGADTVRLDDGLALERTLFLDLLVSDRAVELMTRMVEGNQDIRAVDEA